jgi:hypothetical protein
MPRQPFGAPGPNVTPEEFDELVARHRIQDHAAFAEVINACMTIWANAWRDLHHDGTGYAWTVDETTGRTTRRYVHQGHAIETLGEIEGKLREVLRLLVDPRAGAYQPFFEVAHRRAGPDEPPPGLGRPGAGGRLLDALREAADVAHEAREPSALTHLPDAPRRGPGRPSSFGRPGGLIIRKLARFWEDTTDTPVLLTKQVDGTLRPNDGALFVQDVAAAVMGVRGNARPSLNLIRKILGARSATDR